MKKKAKRLDSQAMNSKPSKVLYHFTGSIFDNNTKWSEGFNPIEKGAKKLAAKVNCYRVQFLKIKYQTLVIESYV